MASNISRARQSHQLLHHEDTAEKVYQITGTGRSFSSKSVGFDLKAVKELHQISNLKGPDAVKVPKYFPNMEPEDIPGDRLFLCRGTYYNLFDDIGAGGWRSHGSAFGYGVGDYRTGYEGFKCSYVFHKGGHKTNWIMNVYFSITEDFIRNGHAALCHVFQSNGSYDPYPKYNEDQLDQLTWEYFNSLRCLLEDPNAFKDSDEFHENSGAYSAPKANGSKGKRSAFWEDFTEIKVLGPNGGVVLTLAICHHCNMAYKTGGLKPKREGSTELVFKNNGTKTLEEHKGRCSAHIAGNPQGVLQ